MIPRLLACFLLVASAHAGIVEDVRGALAQNNFVAAEAELAAYRSRNGPTPEMIEAHSWLGRGALEVHQLERAEGYAHDTQRLVREQLKKRALDAEPHLPIALGAAIEVRAQALAARGQRTQAVQFLQTSLATYRNTSMRPRIQKNLNLLSLTGKPAPALKIAEHLGTQPVPLSQLKGKLVLLFFWAHWCGDCKYESPILARLKSEYLGRLAVVGPTRLYGYAARGEDATPQVELAHIDQVRQRYYAGLLSMPVPVSTDNFNTYGASTTPTLVLLDGKGNVVLYHPGAMTYDELKSAIEKALAG